MTIKPILTLLFFTSCWVSLTVAQPTSVNINAPLNTDCSRAFRVENNLVFNFTNLGPDCCLWFIAPSCSPEEVVTVKTSTIPNAQFVILNASANEGCSMYLSCADIPDQLWMNVSEHVDGVSFENDMTSEKYIVVKPSPNMCAEGFITIAQSGGYCPPPCTSCLSFSPLPNKEYIVSVWAHQDVPTDRITLTDPLIQVHHKVGPSASITNTLSPVGYLIDGWQLFETTFLLVPGYPEIEIKMGTTGDDVFYDDIRFFPADGSMKAYVYDPHNLRFVAELDERHFATFYEYDHEGKLIRVKKETERGRMTIQESQYNTHHHAP